MELLIFFAIIISLTLLVTIPAIIICKIQEFYYNRKEKKFAEKHPEYIEFRNKFNELQKESLDIWNSIEEMKYYPEYSESYKYYKNKLNVAQRKIDKCKEEYDRKENEIYQFVQANKALIETIRDDNFDSYVSWVENFNLDKVEQQ